MKKISCLLIVCVLLSILLFGCKEDGKDAESFIVGLEKFYDEVPGVLEVTI